VAADDRIHRKHERCRHGHRTPYIETAIGGAAIRPQQARAETVYRSTDRKIHEEHPMPAERAGEHSSEKHAKTAASRTHEAEDTHRLGAISRLAEPNPDEP